MTLDQPAHRLWTENGFREDDWRHGETAEALDGNGRVIFPLAAFLDLDPALRASERDRIGVLLAPGDQLPAIVDRILDLPPIALVFPAFNDGRSFSKAELLRSRHGYAGAIRATGQVLIDQIPLMLRTGFTEFEVTNPTALKRLKEGRVGGLPLYYQPAQAGGDGTNETYSWRRRPASSQG